MPETYPAILISTAFGQLDRDASTVHLGGLAYHELGDLHSVDDLSYSRFGDAEKASYLGGRLCPVYRDKTQDLQLRRRDSSVFGTTNRLFLKNFFYRAR